MMDANQRDSVEDVPLREWLEAELISHQHVPEQHQSHHDKRLMLLIRKTTVAYAVASLLQEAMSIAPLSADKISLDNFIVRTKKQDTKDMQRGSSDATVSADILGVDMISEKLWLKIIKHDAGEDAGEDAGRNLEVSMMSSQLRPGSISPLAFEQMKESTICHLFGILLYQFYSNLDPFLEKNLKGAANGEKEAERGGVQLTYSTLRELGAPPNVCMLVQHLGECTCDQLPCHHNAYSSLKEARDDLHLLLLEPNRFSFSSDAFASGEPQLLLQKGKLYGREREISVITDAFSRVCAGESVAFFIGGFSGSGKTRLVESVMTSIDMSGGYVLSHKFDQLSKGRPLLELISAFNSLCVLIGSKCSEQDLQIIVDQLTETFGSDLTMLGRLLPGVHGLMPQSKSFVKRRRLEDDDAQMNLQSVCFILQQFMRVVSSASHPVMIFLDDLQVS